MFRISSSRSSWLVVIQNCMSSLSVATNIVKGATYATNLSWKKKCSLLTRLLPGAAPAHAPLRLGWVMPCVSSLSCSFLDRKLFEMYIIRLSWISVSWPHVHHQGVCLSLPLKGSTVLCLATVPVSAIVSKWAIAVVKKLINMQTVTLICYFPPPFFSDTSW